MNTLGLCVLVFVLACAQAYEYKALSGPPSEFDMHKLPKTTAGALTESSALLKVRLQTSENLAGMHASLEFPVDSATAFAMSLFSPHHEDLTLKLTSPSGKDVPLDHSVNEEFPLADDGSSSVPTSTWTFEKPEVGVYSLIITSEKTLQSVTNGVEADALVMIWNDSPIKAYVELTNYNLQTDEPIGLVARVYEGDHVIMASEAPQALLQHITQAELDVVFPDGHEEDVQMKDDGSSFDLLAGDGVFGGTVKATEVGRYRAHAHIRGTTSEGVEFLRSTQHLLTVIPHEAELTGVARMPQSFLSNEELATAQSEQINFDIGVTIPSGQSPDVKFRAYAEVWGTADDGSLKPACWAASLLFAQEEAGYSFVRLEVNAHWFAKAGVAEPIVLKNVVVQDVTTFIPLTQADTVKVKGNAVSARLEQLQISPSNRSIDITPQMRSGVRPAWVDKETEQGSALILIHGYCAKTNPWAAYPEDWEHHPGATAYFLNPGASIGNDEFATKVVDFGAEYTSYGVVGHSQGGFISLHLQNYYWSKLDGSKGPRRLQSVGTPYHGNSAAGSLADFAKAFGVTCGSNEDMTTDGAALWLTGIKSTKGKNVLQTY